jgi:hypothetical protein
MDLRYTENTAQPDTDVKQSIADWIIAEDERLWIEGAPYHVAWDRWLKSQSGGLSVSLRRFYAIAFAVRKRRTGDNQLKWKGGRSPLRIWARGYSAMKWTHIIRWVAAAIIDSGTSSVWHLTRHLYEQRHLSIITVVETLKWLGYRIVGDPYEYGATFEKRGNPCESQG